MRIGNGSGCEEEVKGKDGKKRGEMNGVINTEEDVEQTRR